MSRSNKRNNNKHNNKNQNDNNTLNYILQSKKPELVIVALLLSGRLKFDSVQLFREASLIVSLVGAFNQINTGRVNQVVDFLDENGDLTIDEILQAFKRKVQD